MNKTTISVLVLFLAFVGFNKMGSSAVNSDGEGSGASFDEDLLLGSWKIYVEETKGDTRVIHKGVITYYADKTESSDGTVYIGSTQYEVGGSANVDSSSTWNLKGDTLYETNTSLEFSGHSGPPAVREIFDKMEESAQKAILNGNSQLKILELTTEKLVFAPRHNGKQRTLKRISY